MTFAAHVRAVRDVEVFERRRPLVARDGAVVVEEAAREIGAPEMLEVHRQERHVAENVAEPQPVVELQTVEHPGTVRQTEDVVGQQVAVTVPGVTSGEARREQREPARQVATGEPGNVVGDLGPKDGADERRALADALLPQVANRLVARGIVDRATRGGGGVKASDQVRDPLDTQISVVAVRGERREPTLVGHAPHDDDMVDLRAGGIGDGFDAEVHVGGETPVERDLTLAVRVAARDRRQVDERIVHRLLQLEHTVALERDDRDVGVDTRDGRRGIPPREPREKLAALLLNGIGHLRSFRRISDAMSSATRTEHAPPAFVAVHEAGGVTEEVRGVTDELGGGVATVRRSGTSAELVAQFGGREVDTVQDLDRPRQQPAGEAAHVCRVPIVGDDAVPLSEQVGESRHIEQTGGDVP